MKKISASTAKKKTNNEQKAEQKIGLAGKIRAIADRLQQETEVQKRATARILGAAAQIANNHERLIEEVVEMVEEDLEQQDLERQVNVAPTEVYTVEILKQKYKTLRAAKEQLNIKANSWEALVTKLNNLAQVHGSDNSVIPNQSCQEIPEANQQNLNDTNSNSHVKSKSINSPLNSDRVAAPTEHGCHHPEDLSVNLDPDVAEFFPNAQAVNEALRFLIRVTNCHIE